MVTNMQLVFCSSERVKTQKTQKPRSGRAGWERIEKGKEGQEDFHLIWVWLGGRGDK